MKLTRQRAHAAWLGAANTPSSRLSSRFAHSVHRASSAAGGCAPICRPRHVRRAARDSGCTRVGAVPEVGSFNAITRESKVWASGLSPPFGPLLWAARSATAWPGCPWGGAAWHGYCALLPRWWSAPAAPAVGVRGSIPRVGPRGIAVSLRLLCCGVEPRTSNLEPPRRQPADAADADAAPPPPTPPPPPPPTSSPTPTPPP